MTETLIDLLRAKGPHWAYWTREGIKRDKVVKGAPTVSMAFPFRGPHCPCSECRREFAGKEKRDA